MNRGDPITDFGIGRFVASILSLVAILSPALSASEPAPAPPALRLGFLIPPDEPDSADLRAAAEIAARAPVDGGLPISELVVRGRNGQWGDDGSETAHLALDDAVRGLITPTDGSASHLVLQVAGRTALPVVSLCPDSSVIGSGIPWLVQVVPDTPRQATTLLSELAPPPPFATTWHALVPQQRRGREIAQDLQTAAANFPTVTLVSAETPAKPEDAPDAVARLARLQPPLILLWLDAESAAQYASALRQSGYSGILAGPEILRSSRFLLHAGRHAKGFLVPSFITPSSGDPSARSFAAQGNARAELPPASIAHYTYDAVLLLRSLHSLQPQPPAGTPPSFQHLAPIRGLTGTIAFDPAGRRDIPLSVQRWNGHEWTFELRRPSP